MTSSRAPTPISSQGPRLSPPALGAWRSDLSVAADALEQPQGLEPGADPGWFPSGGEKLFGWLHHPSSAMSKGSVLICSPVLFEQFLAHATQRRLADDLARSGFTALRFDYRASGDSTGSPVELQDVELWLDDIAAAVDWLRARGASWVALVGMRFGANLLAAASERTGADACVLWDPVASGKALVRQAILLHRAALREDAEWSNAGPLLSTDDNVAGLGFGYPASFIRSVEKVGLDALSTQTQALVLTRDGRLPTALSSRENLEILTAVGQEELIDVRSLRVLFRRSQQPQ